MIDSKRRKDTNRPGSAYRAASSDDSVSCHTHIHSRGGDRHRGRKKIGRDVRRERERETRDTVTDNMEDMVIRL